MKAFRPIQAICLTWLLATVHLQKGHADEAKNYEHASAAVRAKDYKQAAELYEKIVHQNTKAKEAFRGLAWILATCVDPALRDGKRAVTYAEKFMKLPDEHIPDGNGRYVVRVHLFGPRNVEILAAAYAESGKFDKAIEIQQKLIDGYDEQKRKNNTQKLEGEDEARKRLALYLGHLPYHEPN